MDLHSFVTSHADWNRWEVSASAAKIGAKVEGLNRSWGIKPFRTRSREERTTARTGRTQSPFGQRPCAMASAWRSCPAAPTAHMLPSTTCLNCCRFRKQVLSKGVH